MMGAGRASRREAPYLAIVAALIASVAGQAQDRPAQRPATGTIEPDGTVDVPAFRLPPSPYLSDAARAALPRRASDPETAMTQALAAGRVAALRARIPEFTADRVRHLTALYPVTLRRGSVAGVPTMTVTPKGGVAPAARGKLLIDLPGGGFVMGTADGTGLSESIPLAAMAGIEIVSVSYRQAPEHAYPAATEDVVAVYRALLKDHRARDIGLFGCSAGGLLTAEALAAFQKAGLPRPAAAGIFCASADARRIGDSQAYARPFQALGPRAGSTYFAERDLADPAASPILSPGTLRAFPPTLIVSATRAMELSSAVATHRALVREGVEADLEVWDGLGHAFFYDIDLPESKEAFGVMARFFRRHLGLLP